VPAPGDATITVRLTPRAGSDRIIGYDVDSRGQRVLKVAVAAAPVDGAANDALIKLLAKRLGIPKSAITLISGASARIKRLTLAGDPAHLAAALQALA
jgi:uncharacterized protein